MSGSSEALARQLDALCDSCEHTAATPGFRLCPACYDAHRAQQSSPCVGCGTMRRRGFCASCLMLDEDASYEEITAWEAAIAPPQGDATALEAYDSHTAVKDMDECVICLEACKAGEDVLTLQCFHTFHTACIQQWIADGKPNCPVCTHDVRQ